MSDSLCPHFPDDTFVIDMVHHNPGEPPFDTAFTDANVLSSLGCNGQCFKHINAVIDFNDFEGVAAPSEEESKWLEEMTGQIMGEIRKAKRAGLNVFYHVDLIILPQRVIEAFKSDICDPESGKILFSKPITQEVHRHLFAKIFAKFPEVDGIIFDSAIGAFAAMRPLHEAGKKVPEDVSVIGEGDYSFIRYCSPPLTVTSFDARERARRAIEYIVSPETAGPIEVVEPAELIRRASVRSRIR